MIIIKINCLGSWGPSACRCRWSWAGWGSPTPSTPVSQRLWAATTWGSASSSGPTSPSDSRYRTVRSYCTQVYFTYLRGLLGAEPSMGPLGPLRECRRRRPCSSSPVLFHIDSHLEGYGLGTHRYRPFLRV